MQRWPKRCSLEKLEKGFVCSSITESRFVNNSLSCSLCPPLCLEKCRHRASWPLGVLLRSTWTVDAALLSAKISVVRQTHAHLLTPSPKRVVTVLMFVEFLCFYFFSASQVHVGDTPSNPPEGYSNRSIDMSTRCVRLHGACGGTSHVRWFSQYWLVCFWWSARHVLGKQRRSFRTLPKVADVVAAQRKVKLTWYFITIMQVLVIANFPISKNILYVFTVLAFAQCLQRLVS